MTDIGAGSQPDRQPQLGTCDYLAAPHEKDKQSDQCVNWKPVVAAPAESPAPEACKIANCAAFRPCPYHEFASDSAASPEPPKESGPPTKDDCRMLDAIMKAAKQIHKEFDCLGDHVKTKKQIREQIASIIWKHIDSLGAAASTQPATTGQKLGVKIALANCPNCAALRERIQDAVAQIAEWRRITQCPEGKSFTQHLKEAVI